MVKLIDHVFSAAVCDAVSCIHMHQYLVVGNLGL